MAIEDLKPIQRYEINIGGTDGDEYIESEPDKDGEWCKWSDVEKVLDEVNLNLIKQVMEQLKDMSAKINRL